MAMSKWVPTTNLMELRRLGKLGEELGELSNVASRCIIQGLDETDPASGKVNRARLQDELADVQAQIGCTVLAFRLDEDYMARRTADKLRQMAEWEAMFAPTTDAAVAASGECLEHGAYREHDETVKLVPELRPQLRGELKDDAIQCVVSDRLGISQSSGGAPSLEHDVGSGDDLQQDAGTIQVHGRQCTGATSGRTPGVRPDATEQALGMYFAQAEAIRELLDKHAPHTTGNPQARVAQALDVAILQEGRDGKA